MIGQQAAVAEAAQVAALIAQGKAATVPAAGQGSAAAEAAPAGNRDVQQPATQPQTQPAAPPATQPASEKKAPPRSAAKPRGTPQGRRGAAAAAAAAADDSQPGASTQAAEPASQALPASQGGGGTAQKRPAVGLRAPSNQVTVVLPEKLPQLKMLVELETNSGGNVGSKEAEGGCGGTSQGERMS